MSYKRTRTDIVKFLGVPEVAVINLRQQATAIGIDQIFIGDFQQARAVILSIGPGDWISHFQIKRDPEIGIEVTLNIEFNAIGDSKIDFALGNFSFISSA